MKNGSTVSAFERELAEYFGAKFCICLVNGTATLHTALVAMGVEPGDEVVTTPLTMSATTAAILHAGARPVFRDVDPSTWLMENTTADDKWGMPVSLYGLSEPSYWGNGCLIDGAQTFHYNKTAAFNSLSFQASKVIASGEGGALLTDSEAMAERARSFSSLGYRMDARVARIDSSTLKGPYFERHHILGWNYRMSDATAALSLEQLAKADELLAVRQECAALYRDAIAGCEWIVPQFVPDGWRCDYWAFAVALDTAARWQPFVDAMVKHGAEHPYAAWRLTYQEPAFRHLGHPTYLRSEKYMTGLCPIAEDLQPRLVQMQTNDIASAARNAKAMRLAIMEMGT